MNDTMTLSQRADALEQKMSDELDYIVIKSRLYSTAEADMGPAPNAAALMAKNPNARVLMGDDPRLPEMPEKPTLVDFFHYRFGPAAHLLQSARHAVKGGLPEKMVLACPAASPGLGRAEALRQSMITLMDSPGFVGPDGKQVLFSYAHPIFWAPFSLVGDGGGG